MNGILQAMTIDDVRAFRTEVVILGIGSTEPHGPSLPYGTDFYQCDGMVRRAVELANSRQARVLMYPTLPIGNDVNFKAWPFTCRISVRTLMLVLLDIIEALEEDGVRKIVLANGHFGNADAVAATLREHFDKTPPERRAFVCSSYGLSSSESLAAVGGVLDHGGPSEASRMLYLKPELVHDEKFTDQPVGEPMIKSLQKLHAAFIRPWHLHVPLSAGGDTRKATAKIGKELIESSAASLADLLVELSTTPWNPNFPYPPNKV